MPRTLRVLLVEDLPSDVRFIKETLNDIPDCKFRVLAVDSLSKALYELKDNFDVILLDLNLSDSRGINTFNAVKSKAAGIPLIILTVIEDKRLMIDAVQTGAQDFFVKRKITVDSLNRAITYGIQRKKAEINMIKMLEKEKENVKMDQLREEFIMNIADQLRQPLVPIKGYTSLILEKTKNPKFKSYLNKILNSTDTLRQLSENVLAMMHLKRGRLIVQKKKVFIKKILELVINEYLPDIRAKKVKLCREYDSSPELMLDEDKICSALRTIVDNIVTFTNTGHITLLLTKKAGKAVIRFV
ncbi:MAG TPA: hybrid sensor histidine kinase/response regulator, partial [Candidatus Nanoarchaeia archaeon]|nr:hybrid sensor histidine kinase/response regulator [Candidatus Nanoarchaeia archaeon]